VWFSLSAPEPALLEHAGRTSIVAGSVADDPDRRINAVRVVLEVATINGEQAAGKVLVVLPRDSELEYGDALSVRGMLEVPQSFETDTGRTFDYPGYLRARGIALIMPHATLRAIEPGGASVLRSLFALKRHFERALERVMREPMSSLMEGLLLGEKSGMPQALTQAFVMTGLVHIVVLSGYNIGVVAEWTLRLFTLLWRKRTALVLAGVVIVLFALMAGGGMATARAAVMGLIAILARYLNRPTVALRALLVAAALMILYNPLVLFDVGFILSVMATFGLITLSPGVEARLRRAPLFATMGEGMRSSAATTIAVQMFVLPALLYFTGVLSLVSVPLNVVVLPLVPAAMLLGFTAGVLALIHPYLALVPGLLADMLLSMIIKITEISAALPVAAVVVPPFPAWVAIALYLPLTAWAILKYWRNAALQPAS
jgi:competence protein ComEC